MGRLETTMNRLIRLVAAMLLPGCYFVADDGPPPPVNAAPFFTYADAGCEPDDYYRDFVWWFDVDVDDPAGALDVVEVYADVYDSWDGRWADGFELYPEQGVTWYSAWVGGSTWLDCTYDGYVIEFTAFDSFGAVDVVTVVPYTW